MPVKIQRPQHDDIPRWSIADWNNVLFLHFFAAPHGELAAPVVTLNVTGENLREAAGSNCTRTAAKAAFIEAIKQGIGARALEADAWHRRACWNSGFDTLPPFLAHLLLTCMVANDLSEELQWTADFRIRLSQVLGTEAQPLFRRFRSLWEDVAAWSVRQNVAGAGCRPLRLPQIPDSGHHSIIGYSISLAVPSRRDQTTLAKLLRRNGLEGTEPEVSAVLSLVNANIAEFSSAFQGVFEDFVAAFKSKRFALLAQTAFWAATRTVALAGLQKAGLEKAGMRVRLELEDDDGSFLLNLTSDTELRTGYACSLAIPTPRQSPYRFLLTDAMGGTLANILFSAKRADRETENELVTIRSAITDGFLLFEESDDYVFVLTTTFPSTGRLRALVSDRLKSSFSLALSSTDVLPEARKSAFSGWTEWRGLAAEGLRCADFSRFPSLQAVRALRLTIPPPEIKLRGGIRHGSSFVAISGFLPAVEVADAEETHIELAAGEWRPLLAESDERGTWRFDSDLPVARFLGSHRIVAFASSVPVAEKIVSFIETALSHDYKRPVELERWLVESTSIDLLSFASAVDCVQRVSVGAGPRRRGRVADAESEVESSVSASDSLVQLINLLCSRFSAQRGLSEGELVEIMTGELKLEAKMVWPVLRGWLEGGMLDVLSDARWRARVYFGRLPQLVVHRLPGVYEGVLTGLVPHYLLERFEALASGLRLTNIRRPSVSPLVPSLPRCRSDRLAPLAELATELNLSEIVQVRAPEELLLDVKATATEFSSNPGDSWPCLKKWDWSRRSFSDRPLSESVSGISLKWCRRDDGPDRYKLYKDGALLWWTRSRTWAVLAAVTLADLPVFTVESDGTMHSQGDSLYLPLPAARAVAWTAPMNSGPVTLRDGDPAYRYTFHDDRSRDSVLRKMWPHEVDVARSISPLIPTALSTIIRTGVGPEIPVPASLKQTLDEICACSGLRAPRSVPLLALPRLYALVDSGRRGKV